MTALSNSVVLNSCIISLGLPPFHPHSTWKLPHTPQSSIYNPLPLGSFPEPSDCSVLPSSTIYRHRASPLLNCIPGDKVCIGLFITLSLEPKFSAWNSRLSEVIS